MPEVVVEEFDAGQSAPEVEAIPVQAWTDAAMRAYSAPGKAFSVVRYAADEVPGTGGDDPIRKGFARRITGRGQTVCDQWLRSRGGSPGAKFRLGYRVDDQGRMTVFVTYVRP